MGTKVCPRCKKELPLTTEYYYISSRYNGFRAECKECSRVESAIKNAKNKKPIIQADNGQKICKVCGKSYPLNKKYFQRRKTNADGFLNVCNICRAETIKLNWEKEKVRKRKYRHKNPQKYKYFRAKYLKTDAGKQAKKRKEAKRRDLTKKIEVSLTTEQWNRCNKYFNNICAYCGKKEPLEQEHFVALSKGGEFTRNNIIPACKSCNSSKQAEDFFKWYPQQEFYSKAREQKILKYLNYDAKTRTQQLSLVI
jgi:5-methylcytosine-specific restriction endonuclease McrA